MNPQDRMDEIIWEEIKDSIPEDNERTCAVCLMPIPRDEYNAHMQNTHGYETLEITYIGEE